VTVHLRARPLTGCHGPDGQPRLRPPPAFSPYVITFYLFQRTPFCLFFRRFFFLAKVPLRCESSLLKALASFTLNPFGKLKPVARSLRANLPCQHCVSFPCSPVWKGTRLIWFFFLLGSSAAPGMVRVYMFTLFLVKGYFNFLSLVRWNPCT